MIITHVCADILTGSAETSYLEHEEFTFNGKNDVETERQMKAFFFALKDSGAVNVNCVNEDTQVSEDSAMPHLRWGKPYMFGNGGYSEAYAADLTVDQVIETFH